MALGGSFLSLLCCHWRAGSVELRPQAEKLIPALKFCFPIKALSPSRKLPFFTQPTKVPCPSVLVDEENSWGQASSDSVCPGEFCPTCPAYKHGTQVNRHIACSLAPLCSHVFTRYTGFELHGSSICTKLRVSSCLFTRRNFSITVMTIISMQFQLMSQCKSIFVF